MQRRRIGGTDGIDASSLCLGALPLGTYVDEKTSFAILDRFVEAGGTLIDTANNYCAWEVGRTGDESEALLGKWLEQAKGIVVIFFFECRTSSFDLRERRRRAEPEKHDAQDAD